MTTYVAGPEPDLSTVPVPGSLAAAIDTGRVADLISQLLVALGEDPTREGLADTLTASPPGGAPSCLRATPRWLPASPSPS
ncbi:hypothetical protein V1J52_25690 [Streptomyces sp. TRM 70351]|uniref:hypothetical protein n=1 Tax=Streptomyces sp. TRM 70351 TaxID=3116552 RepID=UPI002E7C35C4|nr:hypothetical protein [Streptomyces sp. TRM 70351]MEE1931516.1 hypothetical protein [Streptomyces sp. TRM 70351]